MVSFRDNSDKDKGDDSTQWDASFPQWENPYYLSNRSQTETSTTTTASETSLGMIERLEAEIEELKAIIKGMKECPKCLHMTPHWSDDHYLCDDCR